VGAVRAAFASFASGEHRRTRARTTGDPPAAVLQPGAGRRDGGPPIYLGACNDGPASWRRRRDGFVSHPPTRTRSTCARCACRPGRRGADGGSGPGAAGFETVIGTSVITGPRWMPYWPSANASAGCCLLVLDPAYAPTLELYGWADLGPRLRDSSATTLGGPGRRALRRGARHPRPCGTFDELPAILHERFAGWEGHRRVPPPRAATTLRSSVIAALQSA